MRIFGRLFVRKFNSSLRRVLWSFSLFLISLKIISIMHFNVEKKKSDNYLTKLKFDTFFFNYAFHSIRVRRTSIANCVRDEISGKKSQCSKKSLTVLAKVECNVVGEMGKKFQFGIATCIIPFIAMVDQNLVANGYYQLLHTFSFMCIRMVRNNRKNRSK